MDPSRPRPGAKSQFGGSIAHGFYTLSLAIVYLEELVSLAESPIVINYGLNKVRFPAPLHVGARVLAGVDAVQASAHRVQVRLALQFESDRVRKPVCVAELLLRINSNES